MIKTLAVASSFAVLATSVSAEPTHVMVRALAQDAKFIGDHTGGVQVTLSDAKTGKVLAKGLIRGGTGDTPRIMKAPRVRGAQLADSDTAGFEATLDLVRPTLVRIDALGPLGKPDSAVRVSSSLWVIPGRDISGDGVVLTFPGLVVEPTATLEADGVMRLHAKISPMCGCPIEAGGLWDAATYAVHATLLNRDRPIAEASLAFTGRTGEYAGSFPKPVDGHYTVRFVATDSKTSNVGVASRPIVVGR